MKRIFILLLLSLVFTSCQTEENNLETTSSNLETTFELKKLINSPIGFEKEGKVELAVSDEKLLEVFRNFAITTKLEVKPKSFEVITVDKANYIRFYSEGHKASTIELIKDANNQFRTGGTVCTSSSCASCCGCIPNGDYCTECKPQGPDSPIKGDCSRTTGTTPVIGSGA